MSEQKTTSVPAIDASSNTSGGTPKNTSPTRTARKSSIVEQNGVHTSHTNVSPTRQSNASSSTTTIPAQRSLAATKALSAANDSSSDTARDKGQRVGRNTPQWPTSPRLKSPPPAVTLRAMSGRRIENDQSQTNTTMKRLAPVSTADLGAMMQTSLDSSKETATSQPILRPPGRGVSAQGSGLETVAENSVPSTPAMGPVKSREESSKFQVPTLETILDTAADTTTTTRDITNNTNNETPKPVVDRADTTPSSRAPSTTRPPGNLAKRSVTSLTGKGKVAVEPLRTMTVETETVTSTPQIITDRGRDGSSVRTKPSIETIRPKKEKKKPTRKAPSIHAGTNSSKADIFEAKVANAVDEADSSDSDETFVYESNPPESRPARHHSRTPSVTSLASQVDPYGTRGKHGARSNSTVVGGKKSMKFSNSIHSQQLDAENVGDGRGSTRTTNSTRHHHINRHGRNGHASVTDTDSTFTQANRGLSPRTPTMRNSRPNSPRTSNGRFHFPRKSAGADYDTYDDGADDERAPLMGSVRVNRNRHIRRPNGGHFRPMHFAEDEDPGCWPRYSGCLLIGTIVTLVCIGIATFIFFVNKPLIGVEIQRIQNVLASEQSLMLDLRVRATNPNLFTITVNDLDINIFAQSPYVGTTAQWQKEHPRKHRPTLAERRQLAELEPRAFPFWWPPFGSDDGDDDDNDPNSDPDPDPGTPKMVLGRIFSFDSPLSFDPSPFRHTPMSSVGAIKVIKPGNKTEIGGTARWERVLQHPFELIIRGVIRYQLPLSSNTKSVKVSSRIGVKPNSDGSDGHGKNLLGSLDVVES